jgi:hypothetical protein
MAILVVVEVVVGGGRATAKPVATVTAGVPSDVATNENVPS